MSSIHTEKGTTMRFTIIAVPFITAAGMAAVSVRLMGFCPAARLKAERT